jgi:hypothetical protein
METLSARGNGYFNNSRSGRPLTNNLGEAIGFMLAEGPFTSYNVFCRHIQIGKATCSQILHDKGV